MTIIPNPDPARLFRHAVSLHQAGRLAEAEGAYREILRLQPAHFDSLHMLGVVCAQRGQGEEAVRLIDRALMLDPRSAVALNNRGKALHDLGRYRDALASFDRALAIKPDSADAANNRGNALLELGDVEGALAGYGRALAIKPDYAQAYFNRGKALQDLARREEALAEYDRAVRIRPDYAKAYNNRGRVLDELGRSAEALASYDRAIAVKPDYAEAFVNRGNALQSSMRYAEALASFDRAVALKPDYADGHNNRGNALQELKRPEEALASYERAIELRPGYAEAFNNRGNALQALRRMDDALASYGGAIRLNPNDASAYSNRGRLLGRLGRTEDAAADLEKVLALDPGHPYALGDLVHFKMTICAWDGIEALWSRLIAEIEAGKRASTPFPAIFFPTSPRVQLQCAAIYAADKCPISPNPLWPGERQHHDRIRVAYVSADFSAHATAFLIAELFELHDRDTFELYAISLNPSDGSAIRNRLEASFDRFIDGAGKSDLEIAQAMRALEVDIAVDLKGFTQDARPGIFAHRPAPLQLGYLGYPGTTGGGFLDYMIADPYVIPAAARPFFTEKIVTLPDAYQANDSKRIIAEPMPTRAEAGLPETGFVFCSFNNSYKITPQIFDIWMRLLTAVEGSVLWLYVANETARANLIEEASARGVSPDRLVFAGGLPLDAHLSRIRLADLFLDAFPCNAHTTASDALWAGAPLLTCSGEAFSSRVAGSLLRAIGLPELVTDTLDDYEALALRLARDPALLGGLRAKLARNRDTAPLFDIERFRRHIEAAYMGMWERHLRGAAPESFSVEPIQ